MSDCTDADSADIHVGHAEVESRIPSGVREKFQIMWSGWELDYEGWIGNDGRVWTTDHGSGPVPMSADAIRNRLDETRKVLEGLERAYVAAERSAPDR